MKRIVTIAALALAGLLLMSSTSEATGLVQRIRARRLARQVARNVVVVPHKVVAPVVVEQVVVPHAAVQQVIVPQRVQKAQRIRQQRVLRAQRVQRVVIPSHVPAIVQPIIVDVPALGVFGY